MDIRLKPEFVDRLPEELKNKFVTGNLAIGFFLENYIGLYRELEEKKPELLPDLDSEWSSNREADKKWRI